MIVPRLHTFLFALTASAMLLSSSAFAALIPSTPGNNMLYDINPAAEGVARQDRGVYGLKFAISAPITVTSLGMWDIESDGLGNSHVVGLWDEDRALLAVATVDSRTSTPVASLSREGKWFFTALDESVTLQSGSYTLGFLSFAEDQFYRMAGSSLLFQSGSSFSNGVGSTIPGFVMPTTSAGVTGYVGPNLQIATSVPEAGSIVMGSIGAAGALLAVRLRRKPSMSK